jgi:tyrosyl-tRNA synthetase
MKNTGLAKGSGEAMRLIRQGGVKVNDAPVTDPDIHLQQGEHLIKVGKRKFYKIIVK